MKRILTVVLPVFFLLSLSNCSAIASAIRSLLDECTDYDPDTGDTSLSDDCKGLEGFLPDDQDDLAERTDIVYVNNHDGQGNIVLLITDSNGDPVTGLTQDNITVSISEDSGENYTEVAENDVSTFGDLEESEPTETQFAFATVVDHSGSIFDDDLDLVQSGMETFYEDLPAIFASAIVKFSSEAELTTDFTTDGDELAADITDDSFERSTTALYDGLLLGVNETADENYSFRFVLLFTDGQENDSDTDYDTVKARFQSEGIPVIVVGVSFADVDTLQQISDDSGGIFVYVTAFADLSDLFESLAAQIRNLYRIAVPEIGSAVDRVRVTADVGGTPRTDTVSVSL